jgi:uncharacterized protein (DUF58 family)
MIATMAYLLIHQGDAAGLICLSDRMLWDIPPKRNATHLQSIFDILDTVPSKGETALLRSLHDVAEKVRQRALVVVLSDFFCEVDPLLECFQHLRFRKHDVVAFNLMHQLELDFPFDRPMRFVDLEGPETLLSEPAVIRAQYLKAVKAHLTALREGCNRFAIELQSVATNEDYEPVLRAFLRGRALKIR